MKPSLQLTDFAEKEIFIQAPWGKLAALTWGDPSAPPVFLCHGKRDVSSGFRPLVALLPRVFYYVSLDCPGNGKSDRLPAMARYTTADLVPSVLAVKEHFNWDHFIYIGHSLGAVVGKYFDLAYPGVITKIVELDPAPAYDVWIPDNFGDWYHKFYGSYYREFKKNSASIETAPKYSYEKALHLMMDSRGLTKEASEHVLERSLEPAGDGLYRFNYDIRQKEIPYLPFSNEFVEELYTSTTTPIFCTVSKTVVEFGAYFNAPFAIDEKAWPNGNYKVKIVEGWHDNHINNPECIAEDISKFLLHEKSKL